MKTSVVGVEAAGKKTFCTSVDGRGVTCALKLVLNLFGTDSSSFDGEAASVERPHKNSKETPLAEDIPESSALKGIFE
jgi:hypothetical protein